MTAPCFKCGCARSCDHREVEPPIIEYEEPKYPRAGKVYISGGGQYRLRGNMSRARVRD